MRKSFSGIQVKDSDKGTIQAVFSTFNVVDSDGDLTLPGAIKDGTEVVISAYGHTSWGGALPIGKGTIRTTKDEAILHGQLFMDTTGGREHFSVLKELGPLGEWSYSLENVTSKAGEMDGQRVNFLESIDVREVSPVLRGAGVNTRTLAAKGFDTLCDELDATVDAVKSAIKSTERVVALRAEKGKSLSNVNTEGLVGLAECVERLKALLDTAPESTEDVGDTTPPEDIKALAAEQRRRDLFSNLPEGARP